MLLKSLQMRHITIPKRTTDVKVNIINECPFIEVNNVRLADPFKFCVAFKLAMLIMLLIILVSANPPIYY